MPSIDEALHLDATHPPPLGAGAFHVPPASGGPHRDAAYMAGNSLGLQPVLVDEDLSAHLAAWRRLAVEGHAEGPRWMDFHEHLRGPSSRIVGARQDEVVAMNSLTVNLHLLLASFYQPTRSRFRILIEDTAFPSDSYAVASHLAFRGIDPADGLIRVSARPGESALDTETLADVIDQFGDSIALILLGGVNYLSGEYLDIQAITDRGHTVGAIVGWDLAHAAGNVPLSLHEHGVDFAAWCTYKYLNGGPGSIAGAFIHERHLGRIDLPRLVGWWANAPANRFEMRPEITLPTTADAWQLSNPPILSMVPVLTSLRMFDAVGLTALRERSLRLTAYLDGLLRERLDPARATILTPADPVRRGSQLSIRLNSADGVRIAEVMRHRFGVIADVRRPSVIRLAPTAMYGSFMDCFRSAEALAVSIEEV